MDLNAPPLVPLAVLALASSGSVDGRPPPEARSSAAAVYAGTTAQDRPIFLRRKGGTAAWRIGYVAECEDGTTVRGRYVSGRGTPRIALDRDGRFRLARSEPAEFKPEGTGGARFEIAGRITRSGGSGTWRLRLVTPPGRDGRVACTVGPLSWRAGRG